jgi:hypothetical protein
VLPKLLLAQPASFATRRGNSRRFSAIRWKREIAMNKLFFVLIAAAFFTTTLPNGACGEDGGWGMPNLNPFGGKAKPPTSQRAANPATSGWKMPNLWPQTSAKPKKKSNQPTTWNRMTSGTTTFFSKTADALTPWDNKPAAPPPKLTGSNSIFTQSGATKGNSQKSNSVSPASWWSSDKADQPDKSVNDFLSRPRPQ